jgi:hypothetical protein
MIAWETLARRRASGLRSLLPPISFSVTPGSKSHGAQLARRIVSEEGAGRIVGPRLGHFHLRLLPAIDLIFNAAGGRCLQHGHPLQRAWRDVAAINHHISLNYDAVMSMYGQFVFGLPLEGQY